VANREWLLSRLRQLAGRTDDEWIKLDADDARALLEPAPPVQLRLTCPECGELHVDEGEWATRIHHTHSCQHCGLTWRPAVVPTVGVRFLPGFRNEENVSV
jgi:hypothetical protein